MTDATPVSHTGAKQQCTNDGGRLLLVTSAEEEAELVKMLRTTYILCLKTLSMRA